MMLQALLEDRFSPRIRREPKEQPVYALVAGKGGPKLEKSKFQAQDCGDTGPKWFGNPACHFLDGDQDRGLHGGSVSQTEGWEPMSAPMSVKPASPDGTSQSADTSVNNTDRPHPVQRIRETRPSNGVAS
jgi:hypothetical protein